MLNLSKEGDYYGTSEAIRINVHLGNPRTAGSLRATQERDARDNAYRSYPHPLEAGKDVEKLLSKEAQDAIFHIAAEAMSNACHHAQADNLYLRLYQHGTNVIVKVEDDGVGFDVAKVEARYAKREPSDSERLNLRERAALVKGKTKIQSAPGKGTKITVTIPVDPK